MSGFNGQMQCRYGAEDGWGGCFVRRVPQLVGRRVPDLGSKSALHQAMESVAEEMPTWCLVKVHGLHSQIELVADCDGKGRALLDDLRWLRPDHVGRSLCG